MIGNRVWATFTLFTDYYYYLASAAVAVDSSHLWSRFSMPSNFVNGHLSAMWFMVCCWPLSQEGDWVKPHMCKLARLTETILDLSPIITNPLSLLVVSVFIHSLVFSKAADQKTKSGIFVELHIYWLEAGPRGWNRKKWNMYIFSLNICPIVNLSP